MVELQLANWEFLLTLGMPMGASHCEDHLCCSLKQKKTVRIAVYTKSKTPNEYFGQHLDS